MTNFNSRPPTIIDLGPEPSFFYNPTWSPDSKRILYTDKHLRLWYVGVVPAGKPVLIEKGTYGSFGADFGPVWSPDSKWIAYHRDLDNQLNAIFLYSLESHKSTQVTDGMSDAPEPGLRPERQVSLLHRLHRRRSVARRHRPFLARSRPDQRCLRRCAG